MAPKHIAVGLALMLVSGPLAACGGSSSTSASSSSGGGSPATGTSQSAAAAGALSAEAQAAATGDIPDNQVFLTFRNATGGYTISYPEGWAQRGSGGDVTLQDKNNVIHIVASHGSAPAAAVVSAQLAKEQQRQPSLTYGTTSTTSINGSPVVKIKYSTVSPPNPVTGKRVQLLVDRYVIAHAGKVLIVDLASPKGVDNVDAYRMISHSVRWL
jgi:hypothetical protein